MKIDKKISYYKIELTRFKIIFLIKPLNAKIIIEVIWIKLS